MYVNDNDDPYGSGIKDIIPGLKRGFFQIKSGFHPLEVRPKEVENLLNDVGNERVMKVKIMKIPIQKTITSILNVASLFQLENKLKKLNYDDLYHLYLNLYLEDGSVVGIEKNQRLRIVPGGFPDKNAVSIEITFPKPPSLKSLFEQGEKKSGPNFYRYDAIVYNCQRFVIDLIGNLIPEEAKKWILQDIKEVVPSLYNKVLRTITDLAAAKDYIWKGGKK